MIELLLNLLKKYNLMGYHEELKEIKKDCLSGVVSEASVSVGESKVGGLPDVPAGFEWPMYKRKPMEFLLQINCDQIKSDVLPTSGIIQFFYSKPWFSVYEILLLYFLKKNDKSWRQDTVKVHYVHPGASISPLPMPKIQKKKFGLLKVSMEAKVHTQKSLSFKKSISLPELDYSLYPCEIIKKIDESDDAYLYLEALHELECCELMQIGGYPGPLDNGFSVDYDVPNINGCKSLKSWNVLVINGDSHFSSIDFGRLNYFIHKDDLKNLNFDNAWAKQLS